MKKAKDIALLVLVVVVAVLVADHVRLNNRIDRMHQEMQKQISAVAEVAENVRADAARGWWQKCKDSCRKTWESWRKD